MRHLVVACGILGGWIPLLAQNSPSPSPAAPAPPAIAVFDASLEVTASAEPAARDDVAAAVAVVDAAEIAQRGAPQVLDLLRTVPGVDVAQSGGPGKVASLFVRGTDSNQTLVMWDGVPLNEPLLGGFDAAFLPTEGVARIEVVRGPFSALYGSSAIGGVVNVLTSAAATPRLALRAEGGERGERLASGSGGWRAGGVSLFAAAHSRRSDGELRNDFLDSDGALGRAELAFGGGHVGLLARWLDAASGLPLDDTGTQPRLARRNDWNERMLAVPAAFGGAAWDVDALVSRLATDLRFSDPDDAFYTSSAAEAEILRARVSGTLRRDDGWLAAGVEGNRQEVASRSNFGVDLDGERVTSRGAFAQLHGVRGALRVEAGARVDRDEGFGSAVSPRVGLVWGNATARLRASWGEAFRAPSLGERFYPVTGNPALDPERSASTELAFEVERGRASLVIAAFDSRQRDLIDFDFTAYRNVNVGRARSRGVESEVAWRSPTLSARLGASWLDARDTANDVPLLRRPEWSGHLVLLGSRGRWSGSLAAVAVGERDDVDPVTYRRTANPGYARVDLGVRYEATRGATPYVRIENALDRAYEEVLGFPARGRTAVAGVALQW